VVISPNGRCVAITDGTATIQLWDTVSGETNLLTNLSRQPALLAFSPDGHTLISGGDLKGVIDIWDVARRQCVESLAAHSGRVVSVAISPDGMLAATGSIDTTIKLWNLKTRQWTMTLKGHRRPVWTLAFSPDGKTLISGSGDRTVRLWNVSLRREAAVLRLFGSSHSRLAEEIRPLTFSPDGNNVAGVTQDGRLILLRAATLDELALRVGASPVERQATR